MDRVALADAGQPVGDPGGRGLPGGLGFLADGAALGGALGVEQPLGFLACPDGAAVAADAVAADRGLLADEVADALLGHDQSFLAEPGERQPDGHQARLIGLRERRQAGQLRARRVLARGDPRADRVGDPQLQ